MNEIYCGLIKMQLSAPWPNILNFRETYMGDEINAIKTLASNMCRRQHNNRDKTITGVGTENLYNGSNCTYIADSQINSSSLMAMNHCYQSAPPPPPPPPPLSNSCVAAHVQQQQQQQSYYNNKNSNNHIGQSITYAYGNGIVGNATNTTAMPLTLSHSKSLDHYVGHFIIFFLC